MFQKRRSMLGRRHLLAQQQATNRPAHPQAAGDGGCGGSGGRGANTSWRGRRSGRKRTPSHSDKASKEFKKCLFSKSPGANYMGAYRMQSQDRNHHSSTESLLNETGVTSMAPTPSSTPRSVAITPASLQRRRAEMERTRYGPLPSAARLTTKTLCEADKPTSSSSSILPTQTSYSYDYYSLKPPDSPGPSRLERILLEEKLAHTSSTNDFNNLQPPASPGPSRLDRLIMEEKLEQPLDPDLKKITSLSLEDPNPRLQFSPPLSSTCIGSPDSGKKNTTVKEEIKKHTPSSVRKLSTIKEDCDVSVIEFELNERTICDLDNTLMNTTVKPNNVSHLENILEDQTNECTEKFEPNLENMLSRLESMERSVIDRAINHANEMKILKEQTETILKKIQNESKKIENESVEDISNIRLIKKTLESLKPTHAARSTENKENNFTFRVPTCKKKQLDVESKWFKSVKKENPGLLKTPNPSRKINQSATLTPQSMFKVLNDQINELYHT